MDFDLYKENKQTQLSPYSRSINKKNIYYKTKKQNKNSFHRIINLKKMVYLLRGKPDARSTSRPYDTGSLRSL